MISFGLFTEERRVLEGFLGGVRTGRCSVLGSLMQDRIENLDIEVPTAVYI
jgi:hypothetical protein